MLSLLVFSFTYYVLQAVHESEFWVSSILILTVFHFFQLPTESMSFIMSGQGLTMLSAMKENWNYLNLTLWKLLTEVLTTQEDTTVSLLFIFVGVLKGVLGALVPLDSKKMWGLYNHCIAF